MTSARRFRRRLAALATVGLGVFATLVATAEASASGPIEVGWWNRGPTEAPGTEAVAGTLPPPPDEGRPTAVPVPEGGLYVANDASGPRGVSALRFLAATGRATLTLELTSDSVVLPLGARVVACYLDDPWEPVVNGAWSERPGLLCGGAVEGVLAEDQKSITFPIPELGFHRTTRGVEIAIAPIENQQVAFALAFAPPGDDALKLVGPRPSTTTSTTSTTTTTVADEPLPPPPPPTTPRSSSPPGLPSLYIAPGDVPEAPEQLIAAGPGDDGGGVRDPLRIGTDGTARAVLMAMLVLAAAAAWLLSGGMPTLPRLRPAGSHEGKP